MNAVKITDGIYCLPVNLESYQLFEGMWPMPNGISLNPYIVQGEKIALIDLLEDLRILQQIPPQPRQIRERRRLPVARIAGIRGIVHHAPFSSPLPFAQRMLWPVFAQSAKKVSRPLSVSGCLTRPRRTDGGTVATSAPAIADSCTWFWLRIEAARISVL